MAVGIGGGGFIGVAWEAVPGTYLAPTKYLPILKESLTQTQETQWRRPIRQNVDNLGGVPGNATIAGDIEAEALAETCIYFHSASRANGVKTGAGAPWTYTYTPNTLAVQAATKTLSITVVRNGIVHGYVGCVVSSFKYGIENGMLKVTFSIMGMDEASQSLPTPAWTALQTQPFGAGEYSIQIPTATPVTNVDTFELTVDDSGAANYRLKSTGRGPQFINWGERSVTLTIEQDYESRADLDAFKVLTAQSITLQATKAGGEQIAFTLPVAIKDTYEVGLSGQGELIRASIAYQGTYDSATSAAYSLVIKSNQSITIP
jgi:Phage tail tube protein